MQHPFRHHGSAVDYHEDRFMLWISLGEPSIDLELCIHGFSHSRTPIYSWSIHGKHGPALLMPVA